MTDETLTIDDLPLTALVLRLADALGRVETAAGAARLELLRARAGDAWTAETIATLDVRVALVSKHLADVAALRAELAEKGGSI